MISREERPFGIEKAQKARTRLSRVHAGDWEEGESGAGQAAELTGDINRSTPAFKAQCSGRSQ